MDSGINNDMATKAKFVDYILMLFIILWSGGCVSFGYFEKWGMILLPFLLFLSVKRKCLPDTKCVCAVAGLSIILIIQFAFVGHNLNSLFNSICVLISSILFAGVLARSFKKVFIDIIFVFALISIVCWVVDLTTVGHTMLVNISRGLPRLGLDNLASMVSGNDQRSTIYFYTFLTEPGTLQRNSGPFFEPGRFTIFLSISIIMLMFDDKFKVLNFRFLVLLLADITTFSTTGYIVLMLLAVTAVFLKRGLTFGSFLSIPISIVLVTWMMNFDFMSDKISDLASTNDEAISRFAAFYYHWQYVIDNPLIGYGPYRPELGISPCGWTELMMFWGIPITIILVLLLYKGSSFYIESSTFSAPKRVVAVICIIVLAFSQTIMIQPLYYLLYFIAFYSLSDKYGQNSQYIVSE